MGQKLSIDELVADIERLWTQIDNYRDSGRLYNELYHAVVDNLRLSNNRVTWWRKGKGKWRDTERITNADIGNKYHVVLQQYLRGNVIHVELKEPSQTDFNKIAVYFNRFLPTRTFKGELSFVDFESKTVTDIHTYRRKPLS